MKYAMCPKCGRRLCKGENGTKVEMECPKCGEFASVIIEEDDVHISRNPIFAITPDKQFKAKYALCELSDGYIKVFKR